MNASIFGVIFGVTISVILIISMYCVAMRSKEVDISDLWIIHMPAIVPSVMVVYSILTTDVLKHKAYVGLNAWAWVMIIVFGIPSWLGWFFICQRMEYRRRGAYEGGS